MAHWYTGLGENKYDASLKDARTFGYYPSVTTVDKVIANPGLEIWKQNQMLESALTLTRGQHESDSDFIARVKYDSRKKARDAAKMGNIIHKLAERYVSGKPLFFHGQREDVWVLFEPLRDWIDNNITESKSTIEKEYGAEVVLVNEALGYAGKADFYGYDKNGKIILIDYKTTTITPKDIKKDGTIKKAKIYDSWCRQLAALESASDPDRVLSVIISSNIDFPGVWVYEWTEAELEKGLIQFKAALEIFKSQKGL